MEKVELKFLRITYSHTHAGAYALILSELHNDRRLPIIFKSFCDQLGITVTEVVINDLVEGIFHAKLVLEQDGKTVEIDARSSDAIALALRFQCPIHTYEFILSAAGLKMDEGEEESETAATADAPEESKNIRTASPEDLRNMLQEAIDAEDYEGASKLRDELKRREGTN